MTAVGEAADGAELLSCVAEAPADVVLLEVSMPGCEGAGLIEAVGRVCPDLPVLIFTDLHEKVHAVRAIRAGALGYLSKSASAGAILDALRQVAAGHHYITPTVAGELALDAAGAAPYSARSLTKRELEVLIQLAEGLRPMEIARKLSLSIKTVSTHKTRILAKLGARSTADLVRYAINEGLVEARAKAG